MWSVECGVWTVEFGVLSLAWNVELLEVRLVVQNAGGRRWMNT